LIGNAFKIRESFLKMEPPPEINGDPITASVPDAASTLQLLSLASTALTRFARRSFVRES
jgi:hypothetical protein